MGIEVVEEIQVLEAPVRMNVQMLIVSAPYAILIPEFIVNSYGSRVCVNKLEGRPSRAQLFLIELHSLYEFLVVDPDAGIHVGVTTQAEATVSAVQVTYRYCSEQDGPLVQGKPGNGWSRRGRWSIDVQIECAALAARQKLMPFTVFKILNEHRVQRESHPTRREGQEIRADAAAIPFSMTALAA